MVEDASGAGMRHDLLKFLVGAQEESTGQRQKVQSGSELIARYMQSERFSEFFATATGEFAVPLGFRDLSDLKDDMAGKLFEELAFLYLSSNATADLTVLSPGRAFHFYQFIYGRRAVQHPFGSVSLQGISVPDGLAIDAEGNVRSVLEYSAVEHVDYFERKKEAFEIGVRRRPDIFSETELVFVIPRDGQADLDLQFLGFKFLPLPLTRDGFKKLVQTVYYNYRVDKDSASLFDVQNEARWQAQRSKNNRS